MDSIAEDHRLESPTTPLLEDTDGSQDSKKRIDTDKAHTVDPKLLGLWGLNFVWLLLSFLALTCKPPPHPQKRVICATSQGAVFCG